MDRFVGLAPESLPMVPDKVYNFVFRNGRGAFFSHWATLKGLFFFAARRPRLFQGKQTAFLWERRLEPIDILFLDQRRLLFVLLRMTARSCPHPHDPPQRECYCPVACFRFVLVWLCICRTCMPVGARSRTRAHNRRRTTPTTCCCRAMTFLSSSTTDSPPRPDSPLPSLPGSRSGPS